MSSWLPWAAAALHTADAALSALRVDTRTSHTNPSTASLDRKSHTPSLAITRTHRLVARSPTAAGTGLWARAEAEAEAAAPEREVPDALLVRLLEAWWCPLCTSVGNMSTSTSLRDTTNHQGTQVGGGGGRAGGGEGREAGRVLKLEVRMGEGGGVKGGGGATIERGTRYKAPAAPPHVHDVRRRHNNTRLSFFIQIACIHSG